MSSVNSNINLNRYGEFKLSYKVDQGNGVLFPFESSLECLLVVWIVPKVLNAFESAFNGSFFRSHSNQ